MRRPITFRKVLRNPLVLIFGALLVFILLISLISPGIDLGIALGEIYTGSTIVSLDRMEYQSTNPIFGRAAWNMVTRVDGSGQYAQAVFSPEFIEENFGLQITEPFAIKQSIPSMECEYQITNTTYDLYTWKIESKTFNSGTTCSQSSIYSLYLSGMGASCGSYYTGGVITAIRHPGAGVYNCAVTCSRPAIDRKVGAVHLIDSATTFFVTVNTTLQTGDNSWSVLTTPQMLEGQIPNVMYVRSTGLLIGYRTCPIPATDYSAWRIADTNNFFIKEKYLLQSAITKCSSVTTLSGISECNTAIATITASSSTTEFYSCGAANISGTSTKMRCVPKYQVVIPETQIVIPEGVITAVVPVAIPEIVEVTAPEELAAAGNNEISVKIKNNANISGPIDVVILGTVDIQTVSQRINVNAGETKTVKLLVQGAGLIKKFTVVATSVNDPSINDTEIVKLKFLPFCDKLKLSAAHVLIYTEYGCDWVCSNQYQNQDYSSCVDSCRGSDKEVRRCREACNTNIVEQDCSNIYYTDKAEDEDTFMERYEDVYGYGVNHCVNEREYTPLMRYVNEELINAPADKTEQHLIWIPSPVCRYVAEYGYRINAFGQAEEIEDNYEFYASPIPSGRLVEEDSTGGVATDLPITPTSMIVLVFVVLGVILGSIAVLFMKKKRVF